MKKLAFRLALWLGLTVMAGLALCGAFALGEALLWWRWGRQ